MEKGKWEECKQRAELTVELDHAGLMSGWGISDDVNKAVRNVSHKLTETYAASRFGGESHRGAS